MAQIFHPSTNTLSRLSIMGGAIAPLAIMILLSAITRSPYNTNVGVHVDQPVPFSHEHHANELGIDCRYCHTSVEKTAFAGVPPTETCMSCHSQIWTGAPMLAAVRQSLADDKPLHWNRVTRLPDYVYFNHSIHIARGVPCEECHGRVDRMPLMVRARPFEMRWCLDCHRDPAPHLRPREQVTRMDWSDWDRHAAQHRQFGEEMMKRYHIQPAKLTDCSICHR